MPRHGTATPGEPEPAVTVATPRRGLASWPIRRKLVALVAGPLVLILGAGLFLTSEAVTDLRSAQKSRDLANVALLTNRLSNALYTELTATVALDQANTAAAAAKRAQETEPTTALAQQVKTTAARAQQAKAVAGQAQQATDEKYRQLTTALDSPPGGAWSADVETTRVTLTERIARLPFIRKGVDRGNSVMVVQSQYTKPLQANLALTAALARDLSITAPDSATVDAAATLAALAKAASAASDDAVKLTIAISARRLTDQAELGLMELRVTQKTELDAAYIHASPDQRRQIDNLRANEKWLESFRTKAILEASRGNADMSAEAVATATKDASDAADTYAKAAGERVQALDQLVANVATSTRDAAAANAQNALIYTGVVSSLALVALFFASALVAVVARTVTVPMRRLRAGAVDAATVRLPAMVRQIEREGSDTLVSLPPVLPPGTQAGPETIEVAQAVDGLTSEAVRLATAQVRLRHALDEAFVSMSRRSQSMVEKQLAIIDELESTEEDPEQLRNLFRLDHLAARMRRYNDNLLVLAGSTLRTRSAAPVPIADVFRAATSEMEQYERVRLQPIQGVAVSGPVAGGLVHLLAELLDNAAMYSPPTSPILLAGTQTPDGGLHLEITDSGVGIPPSELADLNARLAMPGSIDTQVPSRMGLYVVARLAQRGGFSVRLSPRSQAAGTVAEVTVPPAVVVGAKRPDQTGTPEHPQGTHNGVEQPRVPGQTTGAPAAPSAPEQPAAAFGQFRPGGAGPDQPPSRRPAVLDTLDALLPPPSPLTGGPRPTSGPPAAPGELARPQPLGGSAIPPAPPAPPAPSRPGMPERQAPAAFTGRQPGQPGQPGQQSRPGQQPAGPFPGDPRQRPTPAAPGAPTGSPGGPGLPSRRPGAALSGNPLAANPLAPNPLAAAQAPAPTAKRGETTPPPSFEAPRIGDLPRRTRGNALAGTPLAAPSDGPEAPGGLFGARSTPAPTPAADTAAQGLPQRDGATASTDDSGAATKRPVRPFVQPRPTGTAPTPGRPAASQRPPYRPGATAPQAGASAATAAAAAAQARAAASGRTPTPGSGLFAATGPATLPGGIIRPPATTPPPRGQAPTGAGVPPVRGPAPTLRTPAPRPTEAPQLPVRRDLPATAPQPAEATQRFAPNDLNAPLSTSTESLGEDSTPIFDSISAWFTTDAEPKAGETPAGAPPQVIDLREQPAGVGAGSAQAGGGPVGRAGQPPRGRGTPPPVARSTPPPATRAPAPVAPAASPITRATPAPAAARAGERRPAPTGPGAGPGGRGPSRWAALGDQQWVATNARAAASPEIEGNTGAGLPRRRPGANLLPSAVEAAPAASRPGTPDGPVAPQPTVRPDAEVVRGRLGSYQRGLSSARRARHLPGDRNAPSPLGGSESQPHNAGQPPADQGGDQ